MMKLFREQMTIQYPIKGKQKGAFVTGEAFLADNGESNQTADRDASLAGKAQDKSQGRPRDTKQRRDGQKTKSKGSVNQAEPAAAGGRCLICEQQHEVTDCFYAYSDKAPEWFTPRPGFVALAKFRIDNDPELQAKIRGSKRRTMSQTPRVKQSHTPTPTRVTTEADNE